MKQLRTTVLISAITLLIYSGSAAAWQFRYSIPIAMGAVVATGIALHPFYSDSGASDPEMDAVNKETSLFPLSNTSKALVLPGISSDMNSRNDFCPAPQNMPVAVYHREAINPALLTKAKMRGDAQSKSGELVATHSLEPAYSKNPIDSYRHGIGGFSAEGIQ